MRSVCVFCGSSVGSRALYADRAQEFGRAMAARGLELVFGAGHIGLMGVLADAVLATGGRAIGVIPRALADKELAHQKLTRLHVVETMHQRKALMADLADGFAALPGGYGTADEFFEILTWAQLGLHGKPMGLVNVGGFFDPLLAWVDRCLADGFLRPEHRAILQISSDPEGLLDLLERSHAAPQVPKWIASEDR